MKIKAYNYFNSQNGIAVYTCYSRKLAMVLQNEGFARQKRMCEVVNLWYPQWRARSVVQIYIYTRLLGGGGCKWRLRLAVFQVLYSNLLNFACRVWKISLQLSAILQGWRASVELSCAV